MGQLINPIGNEWNPPARAFGSPAPAPPAIDVVLDTFSTAGTLASRSGEIGADWTGGYVEWSDARTTAEALVESGYLYLPQAEASNNATYFASGITPNSTADVFCEIQVVVPADYSGEPAVELCLTTDPTSAEADTVIVGLTSKPDANAFFVGGSSDVGGVTADFGQNVAPFSTDTLNTLRLEFTDGGETLTVKLNGTSILVQSLPAPFRQFYTGIAFGNDFATGARTANVLRIETDLL